MLFALLGAVLGPFLLGCGSSDDSPAAASSSASATRATAATSSTTTTPPEPIRIIVAGDSVAYDIGPALAAALPPASAEVVTMVAPALTTPTLRRQIEARVSEVPTDVVVVMVGVWERGYTTAAGAGFGEPGWAEGYQAEVLMPFTEAMAANGTQVLLLREPPMLDEAAEAQLAALQGIWEQFAADHPGALFVRDSGTWVDGATGYREELPNAAGVLERVRRTDGIHLCAAGAVRIGAGIIGLLPNLLDRAWEPQLVPGWESGPWTERFPNDECPPVAG